MTTEKRVSVRLVVVGGDKVKAEFQGVGNEGEQAMRKISTSSKQMGMQVQNASYQVGDFFVQVAGGTHPMRAMAMQLPQLLGGFGMFGAVAGAAASIGYVLAQSFLEGGTKAKTAKETVDDLSAAVTSYAQAAAAARTPIEDLTKKYGTLADEVQRAYEAERQMRAQEAQTALTAVRALNPFAIEFTPDQMSAARAAEAIAERLKTAAGRGTMGELRQQTEEMGRLGQAAGGLVGTLRSVAETYGTTAESAARLVELSQAMKDANGPAAMAAAAETLRDELVKTYGSLDAANKATGGLVDQLNKGVIAAADIASTDMAGGIDEAAAAAGRLAANLFAARQQQLADRGMVYSGRGGDPRTSNQTGYGEFGRPSLDTIIAEERARLAAMAAGRGSKGGAGQSAAQKAQNDAVREAARIYDQTRTSAERYASEQAQINELLAQGHLDAGTAARAIAQLDQRYRGVRDAASDFRGLQSEIKESLLDTALTGEGAFDRIGDAIKRAAAQMLLFGEGPFASLLGGATWKGLLGGLFSFDGGGDTGNAPRSGGLDGKGGFLAMLHPRETVIDRTRTGGSHQQANPVRLVVETISSPLFDTRVAQISGAGDRMAMRSQRQAMPGMIRDMQARGLK